MNNLPTYKILDFKFFFFQVSEIINPIPNIPHGPTTTGNAITKEIHQKTMESHNDKIRAALFG